MTGSPRLSCWASSGSSARAAVWRSRASSRGSRPTASPSRTSGHEQRAVVAVVDGRLADADDLGLGDAGRVAPAQRELAAADRDLVVLFFATDTSSPPAVALAGDQLVDEAAGRVAGAGDELGADAVAVDGRRGERGDGVLVEVAGHHDPGPGGARARRAGRAPAGRSAPRSPESRRTAPSSGPAISTAEPDRLGDVVGVDEQRGADAERGHLGPERVGLGVVEQRERVGRGAGGRHAVPLPGREVGGGREAGDVRRAGGRHRGLLVRAARAHLDARPVAGGLRHPRRGRGDRRVVVVDRQQQRLQQHGLGEGGLDDHQRGVGEVDLALGVAPDVAAEPVAGQPLQRGARRRPGRRSARRARASSKRKSLERVEGPPDAGDHAVAPPLGQPPGEELEDRAPVRGAAAQGGLQHGQLVVVGEQRGRRRESTSRRQRRVRSAGMCHDDDVSAAEPRRGGADLTPTRSPCWPSPG